MSKQKLNLLILEDNPDDAELTIRELKKEGFVLEWERVETEIEFKKALKKTPEIILADYNLPSYNGIAALKLQQKTAPDIPLIIVSGTIGEELAVECLKAGATDYVLKDRLSRLSPVVKRALKEVEERNELKQAEKELKKSEKKYQLITETTSDVISLHTFDLDAVYTYVSPSITTLIGYEPDELIGKSCLDFIHPEDKEILLPLLQKYIRSKIKSLITRKKFSVKETFEYRIKNKSGKCCYIQSTGNIMGDQFLFVSRDITKHKQTEDSLRESEKKYRNLVEKLEEGITSVDENENFIFVNNATSKILGYPKKELLKKNLKNFTPPDEFKKIIEQTSVRKKGKSSKYEINIIKKDGTDGVISITATPIFDDNKKYTGAFGIIQDITERKKMELELIRLSNAVRMATESFVISDLEGKITDVNEATLKMYGNANKEDLIGKSSFEIIAPEYQEKAVAGMKEVMKKGYIKNREYYIDIKDGSKIPVEMSVSVMKGKDGKPIGFVSVTRDIAKRKQAEDALRESETKFRELSELLPQIVYEMDKKGTLTFVNKVAFDTFGYSQENFDKRVNVFQMLIPEERKKAEQNIHRVLSGENKGEIEYTALKKDGTSFPVLIFSSPVFSGGKFIGLRGIIIDITERKKAEEQLKKKNTELESFNKLAIGRELRMIELKNEINELLKKLGQKERYKIVE